MWASTWTGAHTTSFLALPVLSPSRRMAFHLDLRPAQDGQEYRRQQFPGLLVKPGAGAEVPEAALGEEAGAPHGRAWTDRCRFSFRSTERRDLRIFDESGCSSQRKPSFPPAGPWGRR